MQLNSSLLRRIAPLSLALLLAACVDKSSETDSDGPSTGTGSGTDGMSSATAVEPTTGGSADAGTTGTGGMSGTTVEPGSTTVEPGTTTVSETGGDAELEGLCTEVCEHIIECVPDLPGSVEDCRAGCLDQWGTPECGQAGIDLLQCMDAMNCMQLQAYIDDDEPGMCAAAAEAADAVCDGSSDCIMGASAGGTECAVSRECDGLAEEYQCDGATCTCVTNGEPGESCEDVGVCPLDLEEQIAAGEACCGWDWS